MFGDISVTKLLIILVIIIALFGTKKLRSIGKDLGGAVKGFKDAMDDDEKEQSQKQIKEETKAADTEETSPQQAEAASADTSKADTANPEDKA